MSHSCPSTDNDTRRKNQPQVTATICESTPEASMTSSKAVTVVQKGALLCWPQGRCTKITWNVNDGTPTLRSALRKWILVGTSKTLNERFIILYKHGGPYKTPSRFNFIIIIDLQRVSDQLGHAGTLLRRLPSAEFPYGNSELVAKQLYGPGRPSGGSGRSVHRH